MLPATVLGSAVAGAAIALALLLVGAKFHRRSRLEAQPVLAWFAAFWVGIGAYGLAEAAWALAYGAGATDLAVGLFVLHAKIVASVAGFASLVVYLLLVRGADRRFVGALVGAYGLVLALVETFYAWRDPIAQEPGVWGMRLEYARNSVEPWWTLLLVVLMLPPFLASLSYATLLRHARDPVVRWRIQLVSLSLFAFFLPMFLAWRVGGWPYWGLIEKGLGAVMAGGVVLAMWPPRWARARLADRETAIAQLKERARLLV
ncbi:MAG TPA: hypothetical protein VHH36_02120 [Candidatus Thermoplasmatota archaeon]|nr:hypothetical protein [Candidatus Thermoplasmatota archaeon]